MPDAEKLILFEPWNMGDALIAAAIALQDPTRLAVDLDYVSRNRTGRWNPGSLTVISTAATPVATIRGDIRDYTAAKKLFPNTSIRSNGWLAFTAHRSTLLDLPFARGWLPVRNRYRAWAAITSTPWQLVERFYQQSFPPHPHHSSPFTSGPIGAPNNTLTSPNSLNSSPKPIRSKSSRLPPTRSQKASPKPKPAVSSIAHSSTPFAPAPTLSSTTQALCTSPPSSVATRIPSRASLPSRSGSHQQPSQSKPKPHPKATDLTPRTCPTPSSKDGLHQKTFLIS
jgi:hypothetical protein